MFINININKINIIYTTFLMTTTSMHNFNSSNKSWKMYTHTLSSISGDNLTIKPYVGKNILLEVSANNAIFIKQGDVSYNLTNLTNSISNIKDASFSNIDISGNLNPLIVNGSSIGLATKNWNSAYINNIYGETLNTYRSDKTLAINSNISTISGDLITSGNINPLSGVGSSLGISSKIWGNAYIRDVSVTSIDVSGHIICSRDISINIGSSLRRWKNVFSDDLSVNKINGQVYSGSSSSSSIVLTSVSGDIIPSSNNLFKLGDVSRNWSNAYIRDLSISSIDVSLNLNPLTNNSASLGLFNKLWGNAYIRDASVSSIDVSTNLNPLTNNGSSLGLISKTWGNAYIRDVSISYIDVSQNLNPLTNNGSSLGLPGKYWGNAYLRDISISSIDVSSNSINPFLNNSASLGAPSKAWGNAYIRDLSVSSIDVSGNLNPLTTNTLTLGLPSKVWGNAYIRDISISSIDVSINSINPFLNNRSSLGLVTKTWSNAYLRDASVSSIDISQNLNPLVSGSSTVSTAQGTGGTVTISGGYIIHSFTTVGTSIFRPSSNGSVEVLIVGGGGGGGGRLGGGGGGGGVIWIPSVNVSSDISYTIVVGDGGTTLNNGQNSSAFGATGAGGGSSGVHDSGVGTAGGSGGGAASNNGTLNIGGGTSGNILGSNSGFIYGSSGGNMTTARTGGPTRAAGGGGAGGPGLNTNSNVTGDTGRTGMGSGGVGIVNAILGPSYYWAGGGGGGGYVNQTGGYGGLGGGGGAGSNGPKGIGGGSSLNSGADGLGLDGGAGGPNTGGGGGGCGWVSEIGGKGGSGIVVIRYLQGTSGSSGSNLGSSLKRWKNIFVGDLSVNTINGLAYSSGGGAASIVYSAGGSSIVNSAIVSDMIPSLTNTYSLGSTTRYWNNAYIRDLSLSNRAYQEISGDISWSAVNGYYGLAKDAYPGLNPLSSGVKAVKSWRIIPFSNSSLQWSTNCWSPERGIFVCISSYVAPHSIAISSNGINWSIIANPLYSSSSNDVQWESICWSPQLGIFVACGVAFNSSAPRFMRSTNGITWINSTFTETVFQYWNSICWSPELGIFVAVGGGYGKTNASANVAISTNGVNWQQIFFASTIELFNVCWSPELKIFVAVGSGIILRSSNGTIWINDQKYLLSRRYARICWSPQLGIFLVGDHSQYNPFHTSSDGINWTNRIVPSSVLYNYPLSICWSPQLRIFFIACNNYSQIISNDGITFQVIFISNMTDSNNTNPPCVSWSPELGIFCAATWYGGGATISSLKGRPPTSYNVFDSSFNSIDENGKWDFSNIAISGTMTAGVTNVTSDDRLKHNEVIIANGLAVIDQLRPKFYQKTQVMLDASYNGDLSDNSWSYEAGLIAQEVLQIPDISFVVSGGDYYETIMNYELSYNDLSVNDLSITDLSYNIIYYESGKYLISQKYTLNYNSIITYGIAAIKELHAKVKAQDISLLEQQATINSLLTRLQALEPNASQ